MTTTHSVTTTFQTGHVGLNVSDLARAKRFYQEVFGFEVMRESQEEGRAFVFLGTGPTLVLTLWQQSAGEFSRRTPGLHHLSFQVDSVADVRAAEERVRAAGGRFLYDGVVPHAEGAQSGGIFFEDPDGIRLEIYTPLGAEEYDAPSGSAPSCGFF